MSKKGSESPPKQWPPNRACTPSAARPWGLCFAPHPTPPPPVQRPLLHKIQVLHRQCSNIRYGEEGHWQDGTNLASMVLVSNKYYKYFACPPPSPPISPHDQTVTYCWPPSICGIRLDGPKQALSLWHFPSACILCVSLPHLVLRCTGGILAQLLCHRNRLRYTHLQHEGAPRIVPVAIPLPPPPFFCRKVFDLAPGPQVARCEFLRFSQP